MQRLTQHVRTQGFFSCGGLQTQVYLGTTLRISSSGVTLTSHRTVSICEHGFNTFAPPGPSPSIRPLARLSIEPDAFPLMRIRKRVRRPITAIASANPGLERDQSCGGKHYKHCSSGSDILRALLTVTRKPCSRERIECYLVSSKCWL